MKIYRADNRVKMVSRRFGSLLLFTILGVFVVLLNHQHTLKMRTKLVLETLQNLLILTQLSARENYIEVDTLLTDARRDMMMLTDSICNVKHQA